MAPKKTPKLNVTARKTRCITDKIYLIESKMITNYEQEYVIMGTTGNVYKVHICNNPTCTCPDFTQRNNRCKHIYFVLLRIMKVTDSDKKTYDDNDLVIMFNNIPEIVSALFVDNDIRKKYVELNPKNITMKDDDVCPICLDDIYNGQDIDYCKTQCGKCVHIECFNMWSKNKDPVCVMCKASWYTKTNNEKPYINLHNC